jgi:hypothetical protein
MNCFRYTIGATISLKFMLADGQGEKVSAIGDWTITSKATDINSNALGTGTVAVVSVPDATFSVTYLPATTLLWTEDEAVYFDVKAVHNTSGETIYGIIYKVDMTKGIT